MPDPREASKVNIVTERPHSIDCGYKRVEKPDCCAEAIRFDERDRLASWFEAEAAATPLGAEDNGKGKSIYNWLMFAARRIRVV